MDANGDRAATFEALSNLLAWAVEFPCEAKYLLPQFERRARPAVESRRIHRNAGALAFLVAQYSPAAKWAAQTIPNFERELAAIYGQPPLCRAFGLSASSYHALAVDIVGRALGDILCAVNAAPLATIPGEAQASGAGEIERAWEYVEGAIHNWPVFDLAAFRSALEWERLRVAALESVTPPPPEPIVFDDDKLFIPGVESPIALSASEAAVLGALIESNGAATKDQLVRNSGNGYESRPGSLLKQIRAKLSNERPGAELAIILPGGKGRGGYRTTIVRRSG